MYLFYALPTNHVLCRNELMTSTWLQNPDKRPTFAVIVQNLSNICNFTSDSIPDEDCSIHSDHNVESNGYISIIPK